MCHNQQISILTDKIFRSTSFSQRIWDEFLTLKQLFNLIEFSSRSRWKSTLHKSCLKKKLYVQRPKTSLLVIMAQTTSSKQIVDVAQRQSYVIPKCYENRVYMGYASANIFTMVASLSWLWYYDIRQTQKKFLNTFDGNDTSINGNFGHQTTTALQRFVEIKFQKYHASRIVLACNNFIVTANFSQRKN